ncbi:MAG: zinc ribbon domain-containing protein [Candidatus Bathyarchaeia archaeon]|nr:hypothetical protein [Candidatus Bathyarchaeota archaeon]
MFKDVIFQTGSGLLLLLPLLLCCMLPLITRLFQKPVSSSLVNMETDVWFTSYAINEAFEAVKNHVLLWRNEEVKSSSRFSLFKNKPQSERFVTSESIPPRLIKFFDPIEGSVTFEFTETEPGGTVIKVSYHPILKDKIQKMRANFPLKIPFAAGLPCSACGKPILPDFKVCPFCGEKTK